MPLLSLIIPCYNEEESLPALYAELGRVAAGMEADFGLSLEFLFVDDGSPSFRRKRSKKSLKAARNRGFLRANGGEV